MLSLIPIRKVNDMKFTKEMFMKWKKLQATLKTIKAQEIKLRKDIANEITQQKVGTTNINRFNYKIKAVQQTRIKVDNEALLSIWSDLNEDEKDCIKWVPEVVKSKYKSLSDKSTIDTVLTTVLSAPTLTVEAIKE